MTELFINQKLNQLAELDYDQTPENPLDWQEAKEEIQTSYTVVD